MFCELCGRLAVGTEGVKIWLALFIGIAIGIIIILLTFLDWRSIIRELIKRIMEEKDETIE